MSSTPSTAFKTLLSPAVVLHTVAFAGASAEGAAQYSETEPLRRRQCVMICLLPCATQDCYGLIRCFDPTKLSTNQHGREPGAKRPPQSCPCAQFSSCTSVLGRITAHQPKSRSCTEDRTSHQAIHPRRRDAMDGFSRQPAHKCHAIAHPSLPLLRPILGASPRFENEPIYQLSQSASPTCPQMQEPTAWHAVPPSRRPLETLWRSLASGLLTEVGLWLACRILPRP